VAATAVHLSCMCIALFAITSSTKPRPYGNTPLYCTRKPLQHLRRAEKYGLNDRLPDKAQAARKLRPGLLRDETRKAQALKRADGVVTGFDLFDEAEVSKQQDRATRFGTAPPATEITFARPSEDEAAKKARAAKFGVDYAEPDPSGASPSRSAMSGDKASEAFCCNAPCAADQTQRFARTGIGSTTFSM
jgi:hypothetical protein